MSQPDDIYRWEKQERMRADEFLGFRNRATYDLEEARMGLPSEPEPIPHPSSAWDWNDQLARLPLTEFLIAIIEKAAQRKDWAQFRHCLDGTWTTMPPELNP